MYILLDYLVTNFKNVVKIVQLSSKPKILFKIISLELSYFNNNVQKHIKENENIINNIFISIYTFILAKKTDNNK